MMPAWPPRETLLRKYTDHELRDLAQYYGVGRADDTLVSEIAAELARREMVSLDHLRDCG